METGINQYFRKLAQDAYADLEKGNIREAVQRVIILIDESKKLKEQEYKEIHDLGKQIYKLFKESNFRKAEELLLEISTKLPSAKGLMTPGKGIINIIYSLKEHSAIIEMYNDKEYLFRRYKKTEEEPIQELISIIDQQLSLIQNIIQNKDTLTRLTNLLKKITENREYKKYKFLVSVFGKIEKYLFKIYWKKNLMYIIRAQKQFLLTKKNRKWKIRKIKKQLKKEYEIYKDIFKHIPLDIINNQTIHSYILRLQKIHRGTKMKRYGMIILSIIMIIRFINDKDKFLCDFVYPFIHTYYSASSLSYGSGQEKITSIEMKKYKREDPFHKMYKEDEFEKEFGVDVEGAKKTKDIENLIEIFHKLNVTKDYLKKIGVNEIILFSYKFYNWGGRAWSGFLHLRRIEESTVAHEIAHVHHSMIKKTDNKFDEEWKNLYLKSISQYNPPFKELYISSKSKGGFANNYGTTNQLEDVATWTEACKVPSCLTKIYDSFDIVRKKLALLKKYDFITKEEYENMLKFVKKEEEKRK